MNHLPDDLPVLVRKSVLASDSGDSAEALRLLRAAVAAAPDSAISQFMLGAELAQSGAFEEAESAMSAAVLLAPDFPIARFELGLLQFTSGRPAPALLTWQPLLLSGEADPLFHFVHGFAALSSDRFDEAIAAFERGIARNTGNAPLNDDMRMVVENIRALAPGRHADAPAEDAGDGPVAHVLLSNYGHGQPG